MNKTTTRSKKQKYSKYFAQAEKSETTSKIHPICFGI